MRTAHLERARELAPAVIVYGTKRYDFDPSVAPDVRLVQLGPVGALRYFASTRVDTIEINEPLLRSSLLLTSAALFGVAIRDVLDRRRTRVVTYAIENFHQTKARRDTVRSRVRYAAETRLARLVFRRLDRIAFGTQGAADLYGRLFRPGARLSTVLIPALPAPRTTAGSGRDPRSVVFVGALTERKGFPVVREAWPMILGAMPEARLTILGRGPLAHEARALASESHSSVQFFESPPREDIWRRVEAAQVLILPSQPTPVWREQVGLPLVEALSCGTSVVTSDETGIADWLAAHGHAVLASDAPAGDYADAVVDALHTAREPSLIVADLPSRDGRLAADDWLFESANS